MTHDDHDHAHDHLTDEGEPPAATRARTLEEILLEKGVISSDEIRARIDWLASRTPADGARLVARAWVDDDFKERLLKDARAAALELDLDPGPAPVVAALENTDRIHHVVVCTLCSCYPRALLGPPPDWYKSLPYRSRTVSDPRGVLSKFGLTLVDRATGGGPGEDCGRVALRAGGRLLAFGRPGADHGARPLRGGDSLRSG